MTLDELNKIKGSVDGTSGMLPVLRGIYHIRVEYPDDPKNISNKEKTLRNLLMRAEYAYGGTTFNKIAEKFELSYGHTIAICKGMTKKMDKFLKTA